CWGVAAEERTAIERKRMRLADEVARPREGVFECRGVDPDVARIERNASAGHRDGSVAAEQTAQTMQRRVEGAGRRIPVAMRPERLRQLILANVASAERDQNLEQLERLFLRLTGNVHWFVVHEQLEAAQRAHFDGPWPRFERPDLAVGQ